MVTLFLRQGETGKQLLLSFPTTTPAEKEAVDRTLETLKAMSKTVTIRGAASEVMNLGLYLSGVDLAAEGELERINQLAKRLEHMSEVDCDKFVGMLDANKISSTKDILQLTEHLDDYVSGTCLSRRGERRRDNTLFRRWKTRTAPRRRPGSRTSGAA